MIAMTFLLTCAEADVAADDPAEGVGGGAAIDGSMHVGAEVRGAEGREDEGAVGQRVAEAGHCGGGGTIRQQPRQRR